MPNPPATRRSPSDGLNIKADPGSSNQSLATVPNPAVTTSAAKDGLSQAASRKRVILAISVGISIGILAVVLLQIFLSR